VRSFDAWHAQSAQLGISIVVAQNQELHLVAFQWPDYFRARVSPMRYTKHCDGADLTTKPPDDGVGSSASQH